MQESCGSAALAGGDRPGLSGRGLAVRPEAADGGGHRDADREQRDDRQRAVGHGFLRAQQRDQHDEPEKSRRGQRQPHRKGRRAPDVIQRRSPSPYGPVHARCPSTQHKTRSAKANAYFAAFTCRRMVLRTGPFDGERNETASAACLRTTLSGDRELAFLGDPFEGFGRAFDAILAIVAVGRKQPDHLIGAGGGRSGNVAGSKIDSLSNGVLMLQRPLHHARMSAALTVPLASADLRTLRQPSTPHAQKASNIEAWQIREFR